MCGVAGGESHAPDCPAPSGGSAPARVADPLAAWREASEEARRLGHGAAIKREALIVASVADREAQALLGRARDKVEALEHVARSAPNLAGKATRQSVAILGALKIVCAPLFTSPSRCPKCRAHNEEDAT